MSTATPIPRDTRRRDVVAIAAQTTFGPFEFTIWNTADVQVFVDAGAGAGFAPVDDDDFTVTATGDNFPSYFRVVFDTAPGAGKVVRVQGARTHERELDVSLGGRLKSDLIEAELDRQTVVLQELRRDVDETGDQVDAAAGAADGAQAALTATLAAKQDVLTLKTDVQDLKTDVQGLKADTLAAASEAEDHAAAAELAAETATNLAASILGTSTTPLTLGTGSKSLVTQTFKHFEPGNWLILTSDSDPSNRWMHGPVAAYDENTGALTLDSRAFAGSGSRADWSLHISGVGLTPADLATLTAAIADAQAAQAAAEAAAADTAADAVQTGTDRAAAEAAADDAQGYAAAAQGYAALLGSPDYGFFADAPTETRDYGSFT